MEKNKLDRELKRKSNIDEYKTAALIACEMSEQTSNKRNKRQKNKWKKELKKNKKRKQTGSRKEERKV